MALLTAERVATRRSRPAPPSSDEELLARYRDDRHPEDLAELFRRHAAGLGRYLTRYLGDATLAEDVLQDTFLRVHAKAGLYRDGWPVRPWLYAVAVHQAVDALRRSRRHSTVGAGWAPSRDEAVDATRLIENLAGDDPGPLDALQERERQCWVRESMGRLPEPLRQVLALAYDRDLSYAEIAGLLGIPIGTVKSRLHAAVARLRAMADRLKRGEGR